MGKFFAPIPLHFYSPKSDSGVLEESKGLFLKHRIFWTFVNIPWGFLYLAQLRSGRTNFLPPDLLLNLQSTLKLSKPQDWLPWAETPPEVRGTPASLPTSKPHSAQAHNPGRSCSRSCQSLPCLHTPNPRFWAETEIPDPQASWSPGLVARVGCKPGHYCGF